MSPNDYRPQLIVLVEDDAHRQIVNGFCLDLNVAIDRIHLLQEARGWVNVKDEFKEKYIQKLRQNINKHILLIIDRDVYQNREIHVRECIPEDIKNRVFILVFNPNPETLKDNKKDIQKSFKNIGKALAKACSERENGLWEHPVLLDNKPELERMILSVKLFLFPNLD
ncbi:MAG: hypothetical protein RLZZ203_788 [Cyanobacteriota bacterium]|jgi:hypothetical protein|uniref:Uncharacterized protein n=1 Tax=Cuspidothrix issatschenkoi CHARLIE-1 TaxID=2052836 RepID=A0A2S6CVB7_9CYAN|nr:hypothetical protein [Cuspidothrix issatschenkoi]PPJ63550.1 hypothetical protein CUN59_09600 [Cuspidothrix issatschenkoi CHARLIE-1]